MRIFTCKIFPMKNLFAQDFGENHGLPFSKWRTRGCCLQGFCVVLLPLYCVCTSNRSKEFERCVNMHRQCFSARLRNSVNFGKLINF